MKRETHRTSTRSRTSTDILLSTISRDPYFHARVHSRAELAVVVRGFSVNDASSTLVVSLGAGGEEGSGERGTRDEHKTAKSRERRRHVRAKY